MGVESLHGKVMDRGTRPWGNWSLLGGEKLIFFITASVGINNNNNREKGESAELSRPEARGKHRRDMRDTRGFCCGTAGGGS